MLQIEYRAEDTSAVLSWTPEIAGSQWQYETVEYLRYSTNDGLKSETGRQVSLPWWKFLQSSAAIARIWKRHKLSLGTDIQLSDEVTRRLSKAQIAINSYRQADELVEIPAEEIQARLRAVGFKRQLTEHQLRNVSKLTRLPAGATFSVPGAGKTSEALAFYFLRAKSKDRLMVVAPKNAFSSWDEQLSMCLDQDLSFERLRGGRNSIHRSLEDDPKYSIVTYQQLILVSDIIAEYLHTRSSFVFLDESHRIKSGEGSATADAVLGLAHLPVGKLVMSGTPMPQSTADLVPQLQFLFPSLDTDKNSVTRDIQHLYVRTTKEELGLPPISIEGVPCRMTPNQELIYGLLKSETRRELADLSRTQKRDFRSLGQSIMKMLQFCSEPLLLANSADATQSELLKLLYEDGDSPKMTYLLNRTRQLTSDGHKVLIWSYFRRNVEYVANRLSDRGAVFIHGGVDAGSDENDDTREGKIRKFKEDDDTMVLVANPAAAGEGISLHQVCHHAIYLDRTFNAAHYLQSLDRIHRLGLESYQSTSVQILQYLDSLDQGVEQSLTRKIGSMAAVLGDESLNVEIHPVFNEFDDPEAAENIGLDATDIQYIIDALGE